MNHFFTTFHYPRFYDFRDVIFDNFLQNLDRFYFSSFSISTSESTCAHMGFDIFWYSLDLDVTSMSHLWSFVDLILDKSVYTKYLHI